MIEEEKGLPQEIVDALEAKEMDLRHNWMYSFMPFGTSNDTSSIQLVAYCKICDKAVASRMDVPETTGNAIITRMHIPKWGCVPIE